MKTSLSLLVSLVILFACQNPEKKDGLKSLGDGNNKIYFLKIQAKNGDKSIQEVEFSIDKVIIDSLKLSEEKIQNMCEESILYADWNVKFRPSFKHDAMAMLVFDRTEKKLLAYMKGTAENAYGTPDNISSTIPFDLKGKLLLDKDGLPKIDSY